MGSERIDEYGMTLRLLIDDVLADWADEAIEAQREYRQAKADEELLWGRVTDGDIPREKITDMAVEARRRTNDAVKALDELMFLPFNVATGQPWRQT